MSRLRQRAPRLRLDPIEYRLLRDQILQRDGWRCPKCGSLISLEIHHKKFRSRLGDDSAQNLITLCVVCHRAEHKCPSLG
jgi:5-methylcytosine-specific restriction endonuclease McrA